MEAPAPAAAGRGSTGNGGFFFQYTETWGPAAGCRWMGRPGGLPWERRGRPPEVARQVLLVAGLVEGTPAG